jgi:hypothetical protein
MAKVSAFFALGHHLFHPIKVWRWLQPKRAMHLQMALMMAPALQSAAARALAPLKPLASLAEQFTSICRVRH